MPLTLLLNKSLCFEFTTLTFPDFTCEEAEHNSDSSSGTISN